jgi:sec-independent protein translocase protein TatB
MLFDLSMTELLLIGVVALVVIGPKDLPKALRVAGYWVGKARTLSREFQSSVDQMIREAELDEMRRELKKATEIDIEHEFRQTIDPTGSLAESLKPPELPTFFDTAPPSTPVASAQSALRPPQAETVNAATAVEAADEHAADPPPDEPAPENMNVVPADPRDGPQELAPGESGGPAARGGAQGAAKDPEFPLSRE